MALITVVSGTYNRLKLLRAMIDSARQQVPASLGVQFIICDGGSTDGTLEWLRVQSDVTLIEHGELRGAIRAFTDAAELSSTPYTIMANDDVTFLSGSFMRALVHLETFSLCGGVAFAHNIRSEGRRLVFGDYGVQTMAALDPTGQQISVIYAQVGMFRTELGHHAGWWGARDPVMMSGGKTYGADNYLSAKIWEMGYTIDAVDGVGNIDHLAPDALRSANIAAERANPGAFWRVFPNGPKLPKTPPLTDVNHRPRILYLPMNEPGHPILKASKRGFRRALQAYGLVYEWDYANDHGNLVEIAKSFQPHLMFAQVHEAHYFPPSILAAARAAAPSMTAIAWNGDVWEQGLISPDILAVLAHFDIQLTVNASMLSVYAKHGIPAAYWQWSFEDVDTSEVEHWRAQLPTYDVIYQANCYSDSRRELGKLLRKQRNMRVGIYGHRWKPQADGQTLYNYAASRALYQNSKIAIGDSQFQDARGFVSNRFFEALASGVLLIHQHVPGLDELLGFEAGRDYIEWYTQDELPALIAYYLAHEEERLKIAHTGHMRCLQEHSFGCRARQLLTEIIAKARDAWKLKHSLQPA